MITTFSWDADNSKLSRHRCVKKINVKVGLVLGYVLSMALRRRYNLVPPLSQLVDKCFQPNPYDNLQLIIFRSTLYYPPHVMINHVLGVVKVLAPKYYI